MALSTKDTTGRGTSDSVLSSEDGFLCETTVPGPGNVELAKLGDMVKSLKDEYIRASTTLRELESLYSQCSSRLSDWGALIVRIDGIFDSLCKPGTGSAKEEQMRAAETRLWSIVTGGVVSLGLCHTVFGGDDDRLAEKLGMFGLRLTVSNGDGESTLSCQKRKRGTDSGKVGENSKEGGPFEVPRGSY